MTTVLQLRTAAQVPASALPMGGFNKAPPERCRLEFTSLLPGSRRRGPFVCCLHVCSLDAPLNVVFVCFFLTGG